MIPEIPGFEWKRIPIEVLIITSSHTTWTDCYMKRVIVIALAACSIVTHSRASHAMERTGPVYTENGTLSIRFNGDYVKAHYRLFDARSAEEKERDARNGNLAGALAVFFHGHARRPDDADEFMAHFALRSKSGLVLVPVCDTPYGRDPKWRGDSGKEVVLMEVTRHVLKKHGMSIHSYAPITGKMLTVESGAQNGEADVKTVPVSLLAVGYSHGGILSRRIASRYPSSVSGLAHICPAGYVKWGDNSLYSTSCLAANFTWESLRIGAGYFTGQAGQVHSAAWGGIRGFSGDCLRSYGSCLFGDTNPMKTARAFRDMKECTDFVDDTSAPVGNIGSVTVVFGENDTLFRYRNMGIRDPKNITPGESSRFWAKYFPASAKNGSKLTLRVLPGNHIGLQLHYRDYVETILRGSGQLREQSASISAQ